MFCRLRKSHARRTVTACCAIALLFAVTRVALTRQHATGDVVDQGQDDYSEPWKYDVKEAYLGCQRTADAHHVFLQNTSSSMTVDWCMQECYKKSYYYALLENGRSCYCSFVAGTGSASSDSSCASPCTGDASLKCGGEHTLSVYVVRMPDGNREWTEWMALEDSVVASRYRGCNRLANNGSCHISLERKYETPIENDWEKNIHLFFIGCFTLSGFQAASKQPLQNDWPAAAAECMSRCWYLRKRFMALQTVGTNRHCMCVPDVGTSLPADTCSNQYGVQLFSTGKIHASVTLYFTPPAHQRQVLVLGTRYGGLSLAPSFMSHYPNTFYVDEPDSLTDSWGGDPAEATASFLNKILEPLLRCDIHRMPGLFLIRYPKWGKGNSGFGFYSDCSQLFYSTTGLSKCLPALQETCQQSVMVAAKTTRPLDSVLLSAFVTKHAELYYVHMVRDPRGVIASTKGQQLRSDSASINFVLSVCQDILKISHFFNQRKNDYHMITVHYEDLLTLPYNATVLMFKSLDLAADDSLVSSVLASVYGSSTGDQALSKLLSSEAFASLRLQATRWTGLLGKPIIKEIDKQCTNVYDLYPERYVDYEKILRNSAIVAATSHTMQFRKASS